MAGVKFAGDGSQELSINKSDTGCVDSNKGSSKALDTPVEDVNMHRATSANFEGEKNAPKGGPLKSPVNDGY